MKNKIRLPVSNSLMICFVSLFALLINCKDEKPTIIEPQCPIIKSLSLEAVGGLSIKITSPADQSRIPREVDVKGVFSGLPSGYSIRILVYPLSVGRWYPQKPTALTDTVWTTHAFVGDENASGEIFLIGAIPVTESQRAILDEDVSGCTQFIIGSPVSTFITVTRQ